MSDAGAALAAMSHAKAKIYPRDMETEGEAVTVSDACTEAVASGYRIRAVDASDLKIEYGVATAPYVETETDGGTATEYGVATAPDAETETDCGTASTGVPGAEREPRVDM